MIIKRSTRMIKFHSYINVIDKMYWWLPSQLHRLFLHRWDQYYKMYEYLGTPNIVHFSICNQDNYKVVICFNRFKNKIVDGNNITLSLSDVILEALLIPGLTFNVSAMAHTRHTTRAERASTSLNAKQATYILTVPINFLLFCLV